MCRCTTFSALKNCGAKEGDLVVICGIGGLGHLAVQYSNKMGFKTVAISRNEDKKDLAIKLGAKYYFSTEKDDYIKKITSLGASKWNIADKLIERLKEGGKLMIVGTNTKKMEFSINPIIFGKKILKVGFALIMKLKKNVWNLVWKMKLSQWLKFISLKICQKVMKVWPLEKHDFEMLLSLSK